MRKLINSIILLELIILTSCKKDSAVVTPTPEIHSCLDSCNYFNNLVSHHWRIVGEYDDSTVYAKNHVNLIPLSSSVNYSFSNCELDDELCFNSNGTGYTINHTKCNVSDLDTIPLPNWHFIDNNTKIQFANNTILNIANISTTEFKYYTFYTSTLTGQPTITWLRLSSFQPY